MLRNKKVPSMVKDPQLIKVRRAQMVKGAVRLFIDKGFHRTTTREIAKEAGFSIGTLYEYIGAKEDILYLVCDDIYLEVSKRLKKQLSKEGSALERLKLAIHSYFQIVDDMSDEVLVMYQEVKALPKESLQYVLQKEKEMASILEEIIRECVEANELNVKGDEVNLLAHNILVQGQMWTFRRWALRKQYTLEQYIDWQTDLLLKGKG
ncbi:TetR family transcriptional regulator [Alkalihalobacillus alcalophilus ATCC 27647 = CGMCC 1.3604]|uniref:TetR family transcriptional regulator n=1 Tax=Alkalihalobacillus alcalophilus ATCC 27647 = CGMCC 1.3604 TaxID=1218173 RepID=A0A094WJA4_ALKAL|nr:TetR/AcrR family transcriptional regulator [Alkalihalobacillus alcalophilus]KGA96043.1 TetR family transcriptional regulator [Alkalihalobacillus alcalophilus ATCC 27647 = CGMCC 1.3604]MED1561014.1 TetR/AcrR family transcriptional regulator [Alkalihalobacillus alcalophilus]THG89051.1 TetR family transcriptional regulator [Alkalihalobacillus alcalophilus ATCC 27647 = CGMCC 1.3604]